MKAISTIAAVLLGLAVLPDAAAAGGRAASPVRVLVPGGGAAAGSGPVAAFRASGGGGVEVIATGPTEITDGTAEAYAFSLFNGTGTPLPAPAIDFEVSGLEIFAFIAGGWTCIHDGTIGSCAWPTDLDPGESTDAVEVFVDVSGPYGDANTCNGERSPCAWFQARYELDAQRVYAGVVVNGNHPPIAGDDTYLSGTVPTPIVAAVLDNDSDADSDPLALSIVIPPSHGTASIDPATQEIVYTPGPTFPGSDEFWYRIADPAGATDTARVRITIGADAISFDRPLIDIGPVEIGRYAASLAVLENTTGFALIGGAVISAVPADEVAGLLQGTGYDPALVVYDPTLCRPRTGDGYAGPNTSFAVIATCRAPAPLGTVPLLRLTMRMSPVGNPGVILEATTHVVLRSATAAEVPILVNDDVATIPADQTALLRPLANDQAGQGGVLSVTGLAGADPVDFSPPSVEGLIDFADGQGPGGGVPFLGVVYTPPAGYTGTTSFYYAASEIVDGSWSRYDYARFTVTVGATPPPPVAVASGSATICAGGSAPLTGSGGVSCAWSPATGLSDPTSCTPTASPSATTTYSLTVTDQQGQQSTNTATVTITVEALPTASASGSTTIPVGGSAALSGSGGVSCAWSPAAGLSDPASCSPIASPSSTTTYALVVSSAAGCSSTNPASATVTVVQPPVAIASGSASVCVGGSAPLSGSGGVSCAWSPAAGLDNPASCTPMATPAATTTYSLTVTDQYGQTSSNVATATIAVEPPPFAIAVGSTTIPPGGSAQLGGTGGASCAWSPAAGLDDPASCTPIASPTVTTTYALVVTSAAGCASVNPAVAIITVLASAPPDLLALGSFAPFQVNGGQSVDVTALVINLSPNPAGATSTRVYFSTNARLDAQDVPLQAAPLPPLAAWGFALPTVRVTVPNAPPGNYYLITALDDGQAVAESDETNNTTAWRIRVR